MMQFDPWTQWRLEPNKTLKVFSGGVLSDWKIDGNGFVAVPESESYSRTIAVFGGSFVWGVGATSYLNTLPACLARLMPDTRVLNCGMRAYHSFQELILFLRYVRHLLKPGDTVLVINGFNDFYYWSQCGIPDYLDTPYIMQVREMVNSPIKHWLQRVVKRVIRDNPVDAIPQPMIYTHFRAAADNYLYTMRVFRDAVRESHMRFVWTLQPVNSKEFGPWAEACVEEPDFQIPAISELSMWTDFCHMTDQGYERVAEMVWAN